ncbi:MAG: type II secretion system protein M [Desulfobacterales bacterium]|nr:type II secretion system protein M [Desulfobacterales bacterium]
MNRREKWAISAGAAVVCLFLIVQFVAGPVVEKRNRLRKDVQAKTGMLADMASLISEYESLQKRGESARAGLSGRDAGFSLFTFIDRLADKTNVKQRIAYMKPSTVSRDEGRISVSMVEMKLQGVTLDQLTPFLYKIETSKNRLTIPRISISKSGGPRGLLHAVLRVEAVQM